MSADPTADRSAEKPAPDAASASALPSVLPPPSSSSSSTPTLFFLALAVLIPWAHLELARFFGVDVARYMRAFTEPWLSAAKYLAASFVVYCVKGGAVRYLCRTLLGFTAAQTHSALWSVDNFHLVSTGVGAAAIVFGTDEDVEGGALFLFGLLGSCGLVLLIAIVNINYSEGIPDEQTAALPPASTDKPAE